MLVQTPILPFSGSIIFGNTRYHYSIKQHSNKISVQNEGGTQKAEWRFEMMPEGNGSSNTHLYLTDGNNRMQIQVAESNTTVILLVLVVVLLAFVFSYEKAPQRGEVHGTLSDIQIEDLQHWQTTEEIPSDQFYDQTFSHVKTLTCSNGTVVYLIGTNHASKLCGKDVDYLVNQVKPDVVMVELCPSRTAFIKNSAEPLGWDIRAGYQAAQKLDIPCILSDQDSIVTQDQLLMEQISLTLQQQASGGSLTEPSYNLFSKVSPEAFDAVIRSERDVYLARSILAATTFPETKSIVCQVGLAHLPGIEQYLTHLDRRECQALTKEFEETWSLNLSNVTFRELSYNLFYIVNKARGEPRRLMKIRGQIQSRYESATTNEERQTYGEQLQKLDVEIQNIRNSRRGDF